MAKSKRLPPTHTIYFYKGRNESHAHLRATLRCKPWKIMCYSTQGEAFEEFLIDFIRFTEDGHWVYPKGETDRDEEWLLGQIQSLLT